MLSFNEFLEQSGLEGVVEWLKWVLYAFIWIFIIMATLSLIAGTIFAGLYWFGEWSLVVSIPIVISFLVGTIGYFVNRWCRRVSNSIGRVLGDVTQ